MAVPAHPPPGYARRTPEQTVLYGALREHAETFLADVETDPASSGLPGFVRAEVERFLKCGILAHGFVRVYCPTCQDDLLVGFSCKGRGLCPSCGARRMADTARRWVDGLLPHVPYRQWVLTLPFPLRLRLAWDHELLGRVLDVFQRAIGMRLRSRTRARGLGGGRHASVTVVQRFGSSLNLNVHFHSLVAEGVWVDGTEGPRFVPVRVGPDDVEWVVRRVHRMAGRLLGRAGLLDEDVEDGLAADVEHPLHLHVAAASVLGRTALGSRAGRAVRAVGRRRLDKPPTRADKRARRRRMQSAVGGFDLQAGVRIAARHRHQLEHLARYILRPAVSTERLKALPDGRFLYELRRPWADGTTGFLFDPHELIEKLVALIPLPRGNLVRYHGLFAPRAAGRSGVVPAGEGGASSGVRPAEQVPHRLPWADLLRRVFLVDVLCCTRCGGRRRVLEAVTEPGAAARILLHLGLEASAPRAEPARAPPDHLGIAS
jgi:hypothetical protein